MKNKLSFWNRRKQLMLQGFGSKCQICGYNKCQKALEFHHINPNEKELTLSSGVFSWELTKTELKKCICVCSNCHREIHDGLVQVDTSKQYFDESLVSDYNPKHSMPEEYYDICPICGGKKLKTQRACSRQCFNRLPVKIDWSKYDLVDMIEHKHISKSEIARKLNVSEAAVRKRYRKLKGL